MRPQIILASATILALAATADAHTAYLMPADFSPDGGEVAISAGYATQFFTPEIALGVAGLSATRPDGTRAIFDSIRVESTQTSLELLTLTQGTYRISTGEVLGAVTTLVGEEGTWRPLGQGEVPAPDALLQTLQTVTLAESYVTRGRPDERALQEAVGRLAIRPVTHPNQVLLASGFELELLFDGQPFANMPFVLYGEGDPETDLDRVFVTGANGRATLTFDQPGKYMVAIRHRTAAPAGAAAQVQSYTTSLTFEVQTALPHYPPPPEEPQRRRRRY